MSRPAPWRRRPCPPRRRPRGYVLLLVTAAVAVALVSMLVGSLNSAAVRNRRAEVSAAALAQAREALIGYALARRSSTGAPNARPGELPCPDRDDDGDDDGSCSAGEIGRLPWRSLGLAPPIDGSGELIWYALAGAFRNRNMNNNPINSGTRGNLVVYGGDGVGVLADDVVFVLFAAGPPLAGQDRSAATAVCPYDGASKAANRCPDNYLEAGDPDGAGPAPVRSNAVQGGPFIATVDNALFNDRLLYVRTDEFIRRVEHGVGSEARQWLLAYQASNAKLPFPADGSDALCIDGPVPATPCVASSAVCSGRFPESAAAINGGAPEPEFSPPLTDPSRVWFINEQWSAYMAYATGTALLPAPVAPTTPPAGCAASVTLDAAARGAVVVMPGSRPAALTWPSTNLATYLEDAANQDAWSTAPGFQDFVSPTGASNDRILAF